MHESYAAQMTARATTAAVAAIRAVFGSLSTLDPATLRALGEAVGVLGTEIADELARRAYDAAIGAAVAETKALDSPPQVSQTAPRTVQSTPAKARALPTADEISARFPAESRWQRADGADFAGTALRVRQCLAGLTSAGDWLHGVTCSVRLQRYSMGRAISVVIKSVPPGLTLRSATQPEGTPAYAVRRYTPEAQAILDTVEGVLAAHNRDRSLHSHDGGDTIYNVDFATHLTFAPEIDR
jgi:hypothetical protein